MNRHVLLAAIAAGAAGLAATNAGAAVAYSTAGSTYSQNFDSLPNSPTNATLGNSPTGWTDDNAAPGAGNFSILGWYLRHDTGPLAEGGFNGNQRMRLGNGNVNTGAFWSYGGTGSTERALSSLASNTTAAVVDGQNQYIALRLTNNTGITLDSFTLEYDGEQWRDGGAAIPVAQSMLFSYMVNAANIKDAGFTAAPSLNFTSPVFVNTGAGAAVDGNAAGRVNNISATVGGLTWLPGQDLWVRWADLNDSGNDHGLGIDDVNFSATPEPASLGLLAIGALGLARRRRSR